MFILDAVKDFNDKVNEFVEPVKAFIMENHGNPVFWIVAFGLGVGVFFLTYNTLHGNND